MALATGDLFARIVATFLAPFGRADGLAVDDRYAGRRLLAHRLPNPSPQSIVNLRPDAAFPPAPKDRIDAFPIGEVLRQLPPLTPRANHIQNRVDDNTSIDWPSTRFGWWWQQP